MERYEGEKPAEDSTGVAKRDAGSEATAMGAAERVVEAAGGRRPAEKAAGGAKGTEKGKGSAKRAVEGVERAADCGKNADGAAKEVEGAGEAAGEERWAAGATRNDGEGAEVGAWAANAGNSSEGGKAGETAADQFRGATGDRGKVVRPERRVAAPTGTARQSGVDVVAKGGGLDEPRGTPEASSFERRRSLPVESNEFIVLRTVITRKHFYY